MADGDGHPVGVGPVEVGALGDADPGPLTAGRLAALERRVSELEARTISGAGSAPTAVGSVDGAERGVPGWSTGDTATGGTVAYRGDVTLAGRVVWSIELTAEAILQLPDSGTSAVLAGLGHPARAAMVRRLLHGPAGVADLQQAVGSTSTGQLYHHLRTLTGCGLVEVDGRGSYRVPTTAVVPALALLLGAADVAGHLTAAPRRAEPPGPEPLKTEPTGDGATGDRATGDGTDGGAPQGAG